MSRVQIENVLKKYFPLRSIPLVTEWIIIYRIKLKISRRRSTKYGDYRSPAKGDEYHYISVNHDLNPYAFLITFVHEVAHLVAWADHGNRIAPHGSEWKVEYKRLMRNFYRDPYKSIFPEDIREALAAYMRNPASSSCTDIHLLRILKKYDETNGNSPVFLEDIPEGSVFKLESGKVFRKGEKLRKRYRCTELGSCHIYMVSPLQEVISLREEHNR